MGSREVGLPQTSHESASLMGSLDFISTMTRLVREQIGAVSFRTLYQVPLSFLNYILMQNDERSMYLMLHHHVMDHFRRGHVVM